MFGAALSPIANTHLECDKIRWYVLYSCHDGLHDIPGSEGFSVVVRTFSLSPSLSTSAFYSRYDLTVCVCIDNNVIIILRKLRLAEKKRMLECPKTADETEMIGTCDSLPIFSIHSRAESSKRHLTKTHTVSQTNISNGKKRDGP